MTARMEGQTGSYSGRSSDIYSRNGRSCLQFVQLRPEDTPLDRPEVTKTPAGGESSPAGGLRPDPGEGKREMDVWLSDGRLATPCELGVQPVV